MKGKVPDVERLRGFDAVQAHLLQHGAGRRSLQRQCGNVIVTSVRDVIEAEGSSSQPGSAGTAAGQHELVVGQLEDRAVVDHAAFVGAPDAVGDPVEPDLR